MNRADLAPSLHGVLVLALSGLLFSLFWATALYAQRDGQRLAEYTAQYPNSLPAVEIYSTRRLQVIGPGVTVRDLGLDNLAAYRFQYSGLRLLTFPVIAGFSYRRDGHVLIGQA